MSSNTPSDPKDNANHLDVYKELCNSYRGIDDFRAKLLALLPLATGAGAALLLGNITTTTEKYLGPIGIFGFVITLGLFAYELFGIRKCHAYIKAGKRIEVLCLTVVEGQFCRRPHSLRGFVDEPFAAGIIYPAVLASWMYIALIFSHPEASEPAATIIFFVGFVGMLIYDYWLRGDGKKFNEKLEGETNGNILESY